MVASLCVLFEALSVVFCLHILYGKRLYLNGATIGFVLLDMALMICVNLFHLDQRWSFSIYPIIMVYCAIEFELNFKAIFVNNILYLVIISILQAVMMLLTWLLFQKLGTIEQMIINFMILGIVIWVLPKCRLDKLSNLLQRNERLITYALLIMIMGMFGFLIKYKSNIGFDLYYYIILLFSLLLIISAAVSIGKSKLKEAEVEAELRLHKVMILVQNNMRLTIILMHFIANIFYIIHMRNL